MNQYPDRLWYIHNRQAIKGNDILESLDAVYHVFNFSTKVALRTIRQEYVEFLDGEALSLFAEDSFEQEVRSGNIKEFVVDNP